MHTTDTDTDSVTDKNNRKINFEERSYTKEELEKLYANIIK